MPISSNRTLGQLALLCISILCTNMFVGISSGQELYSGLVQVAEQPTISSRSLPPSELHLSLVSQREDESDESNEQSDEPGGSDADEEQDDSLAPMQNRDLSSKIHIVNLSVGEIGTGLLPESTSPRHADEPVMMPGGAARGAASKCVHWRASAICHYPLYFEDAMLERHGQVRFGHLQPLASGAKFFTTISLLPYLKTLRPTCESRYTLGHYRPGGCAPVLRDYLPWDKRAAAVEAVSAAGFFWAMPL